MAKRNEILSAIESLRSDVNGKLDDIAERLKMAEAGLQDAKEHIQYQQEDISNILRRLERLEGTSAEIWRSKDGLRVGYDRETAYSVFRELGLSPRDALKRLDVAGYIDKSPCDKHRTPLIRRAEEPQFIRAVVVRRKNCL